MRKRFEHTFIEGDESEDLKLREAQAETLKMYGEEGWELISVVVVGGETKRRRVRHYFSRPIDD